jgi:hypothetical protein
MNNKLFRLVAVMAMTIVSANQSNAQWIQTNGPVSPDVQRLATNGRDIFAVTSNNGVFISTNNGQSWMERNTGLPGRTSSILLMGDTLLVGTLDSGVYLSKDNGLSWAAASMGLENKTVTGFAKIDTLVFVATDGAGVFVTKNLGLSWASLTLGLSDKSIKTIIAVDRTIFVGTNGHGIFRFSTGDSSWTETNTGLTGISLYVYDLLSIDTALFAATSSGIGKSIDKGASWIKMHSGFITALSGNKAMLFEGNDEGVINCFDNARQTWSQSPPCFADTKVTDLLFKDSTLFAASAGAGTCFSKDFGASWTHSNAGMKKTEMEFLKSDGKNLFTATRAGGIFLSTDNGNSWNTINDGLTSFNITALHNFGTTLYAATYDHGIFISLNNGALWKKTKTEPMRSSISVFENIGNSVIAGSDYAGVYRSSDSGSTWQTINTGISDNYIRALTKSGDTLYLGVLASQIFTSIDGGSSWIANKKIFGTSVNDIVVSGNTIYVGTGGNHVFVSVDKGATWTQSDLTLNYVNDLLLTDGSLFAACSWGLKRSNSAGKTWTTIDDGLKSEAVMLAVCDGYLFAATRTDGVWRRPISELVPVRNPHQSAERSPFVISERHCSDATIAIGFSIPCPEMVSLKIYTLSGRELKTLVHDVFSPGSHVAVWNTRNIANGCYSVKMQIGANIFMKALSVFR